MAEILNEVVDLCIIIQNKSGKMIKDFVKEINNYEVEIKFIKEKVNKYMEKFDFY